jgi:hypothetical protein
MAARIAGFAGTAAPPARTDVYENASIGVLFPAIGNAPAITRRYRNAATYFAYHLTTND